MKKMMILAMMMTIAIAANAMSYTAARNEALFLSDKMAYELGLNEAQYEAVYEINLDYLMNVGSHADVFGTWWSRRNHDLHYVLTAWQYQKYVELTYFYRPMTWTNGSWTFSIRRHYAANKFYHAHPKVYVTYKGGNSRKANHFYAQRNIVKPNMHKGTANRPVVNGHMDKPRGNGGSRQMAMNNGSNRQHSHFGGRR